MVTQFTLSKINQTHMCQMCKHFSQKLTCSHLYFICHLLQCLVGSGSAKQWAWFEFKFNDYAWVSNVRYVKLLLLKVVVFDSGKRKKQSILIPDVQTVQPVYQWLQLNVKLKIDEFELFFCHLHLQGVFKKLDWGFTQGSQDIHPIFKFKNEHVDLEDNIVEFTRITFFSVFS